jgi:hypothetical protein
MAPQADHGRRFCYDFLERFCNVRWFTPTESGTDCPRQATLTVTGKEVRRAPFMKYRYAAYPSSENYDQYTGLWPAGSEGYTQWEAAAYPELHRRFDGGGYTLAKRGWNMLFRLRHREGGQPCPGNHSLYGYYRRFWAEEQGQDRLFEGRRADWFAQGYEGQSPQMCYSRRGLVEQVAKDACEFFETGKNYPGAQAGGDCFCVEPMDNDRFCKCARCQQWLTGRDADSPFFTNGRHSDYFFQFVNEVAKLVGPKHPDKHIVCLAYMTHGAPPQRLYWSESLRSTRTCSIPAGKGRRLGLLWRKGMPCEVRLSRSRVSLSAARSLASGASSGRMQSSVRMCFTVGVPFLGV